MRLPMTLAICVVILLGMTSAGRTESEPSPGRKKLQAAYLELLALFPEENQGKGVDPEHVSDHQPMTYGLVLWAESIRLRKARSADGERRVRRATRWLIDHRDLDRDGKPGWGLPQAWDAAADGSENPPHTPYTITTGIVLLGLLEAAAIPDFWKPPEVEEIRQVVHASLLRWCREMWVEGYSGGYFRYSSQPSDDFFSVNAPAMVLGALSRYLHDYGRLAPSAERALMQQRSDTFVKTMIATLRPRGGRPYWDYLAPPNRLKSDRPNDLVHHLYTLWGIEMYRDLVGKVPLPWTRMQARESVAWFWKDERICNYPRDEMRIVKAGNREYPSILWGAGGLLAFYGHWGTETEAAHCFEVLQKSYGPWPRQRLYPAGFGLEKGDDTFYPRYGAHVLLGLAYAGYASATADAPGVQPQSAAPDAAAVLKRVTDDIRENYRRIPHLTCKLKSTFFRPDIKERTVVRGNVLSNDGQVVGQFVGVEEPQSTTFAKVLISGPSLRIDSRRILTGEETFESFHKGIYANVMPHSQWAARYYFRDMPGLANRDPRNIGAREHKHEFVKLLEESRLTRHEKIAVPGGEHLVLHLERDYPEVKMTASWRCEVDPHRNHLPCRLVYYVGLDPKLAGKINSVLDVEYQEVPECKAWFLKKSVDRNYSPRMAEQPDEAGWSSQWIMEIQGKVQILDPVEASRFELHIPAGVELRDSTRGREPEMDRKAD